jgi:hypothetical protein
VRAKFVGVLRVPAERSLDVPACGLEPADTLVQDVIEPLSHGGNSSFLLSLGLLP